MTNNDPQVTRISAKDLGYLALPEACDRCFWIKQKCKPLPFQIFPGIFNSIDAYSKKLVHAAFDHYGQAPSWLPQLKDVYRYHSVPHWSKFVRKHQNTGIVVSGVPDGILEKVDSTILIPDYKTAKFTDTQDKLYPMYEVQLNGYAFIQNGLSQNRVSDLWLFYFQPVTVPTENMFFESYPPEAFDLDGPDMVSAAEIWPITKYLENGFDMQFEVHALNVPILPHIVDEYLEKANTILSQDKAPDGRHDCKDCANLSNMVTMLGLF